MEGRLAAIGTAIKEGAGRLDALNGLMALWLGGRGIQMASLDYEVILFASGGEETPILTA